MASIRSDMPEHIAEWLYTILLGHVSMDGLAPWIYETDELRDLLEPDDYLSLRVYAALRVIR